MNTSQDNAQNKEKAVPLFSEATADFLLAVQDEETIRHFFEGAEYSFAYLIRKLVLPVWDFYCDNFFKLLLPLIIFNSIDLIAVFIAKYFQTNFLPVVVFILFIMAPIQVSKNLFFIKLLHGEKWAFFKGLKVFTSLRFYWSSLVAALIFAFCLMLGLSMMFLPGLIFYSVFGFVLFFVADERMQALPALKMSFLATRGYRIFLTFPLLINALIQAFLPSIFGVSVENNTIDIALAFGLWNIVGFSLYTFFIAPLLQVITTGLYFEAKTSIYRLVLSQLKKLGEEGKIKITVTTTEAKDIAGQGAEINNTNSEVLDNKDHKIEKK